MDNIGDILYVLFIVIALVASVMKKRKQQEAVPPFMPDREQELNLPEELKEIFQKKRPEFIRPRKARTEAKQELVKTEPEKRFKTGIVTSVTARKTQEAYEQEVTGEDNEGEEVDWQRAIILSEILKGPQHFPG